MLAAIAVSLVFLSLLNIIIYLSRRSVVNPGADPSVPLSDRGDLAFPYVYRTDEGVLLCVSDSLGTVNVFDRDDNFVCCYKYQSSGEGSVSVYGGCLYIQSDAENQILCKYLPDGSYGGTAKITAAGDGSYSIKVSLPDGGYTFTAPENIYILAGFDENAVYYTLYSGETVYSSVSGQTRQTVTYPDNTASDGMRAVFNSLYSANGKLLMKTSALRAALGTPAIPISAAALIILSACAALPIYHRFAKKKITLTEGSN